METLIAAALQAGAGLPLLRSLLDCVSTDAALDYLREAGLLSESMEILGKRMEENLARFAGSTIEAAFVCFAKTSSQPAADTGTDTVRHGEVATQSGNAARMMEDFRYE
jgi:cobalamin biosynthesis protein CbiD